MQALGSLVWKTQLLKPPCIPRALPMGWLFCSCKNSCGMKVSIYTDYWYLVNIEDTENHFSRSAVGKGFHFWIKWWTLVLKGYGMKNASAQCLIWLVRGHKLLQGHSNSFVLPLRRSTVSWQLSGHMTLEIQFDLQRALADLRKKYNKNSIIKLGNFSHI